MAEIVKADVCGKPGLLEQSLEGTHHGIPPADLALCVREDEAGISPCPRRHAFQALTLAVLLQDLDGAGSDTDTPLLARLGRGDDRPGTGVRGAPYCDGRLLPEVEVLPPQGAELPLVHPRTQGKSYQGLVSRTCGGA